jgi:Flp pilus assembly protein TadG
MRVRRWTKDESGQAMTEFAVVLPLLVVLLFGIVQFGIIFNNYVTLTDAVRAGARVAAVSREAGNPTSAATDAVRSSAPGLDTGRLPITVDSTWQPGSDVTVTAKYPYSVKLLGWVVASGDLTSKTTERVE